MTRVQATLLSQDNKEIYCEYYEIETIFRRIIENDVNLANDFNEFSKDYSYFNPYIDYAMFKLGYKIKNPLNLEGALLEAKDNAIYLRFYSEYFEIFPKCDDQTIGLFQLSPDTIEICMADENLFGIRPAFYKHEKISRILLNYLFMKDPSLYIRYVEELEEEETTALFFEHTEFLIKNVSFLRVEKLIINEKLKRFQAFKDKEVNYEIEGSEKTISEKQKLFIEECMSKGILSIEDIHLIPDEERKKAV